MKERALNSSGASLGGLKSIFSRSLATSKPVMPPAIEQIIKQVFLTIGKDQEGISMQLQCGFSRLLTTSRQSFEIHWLFKSGQKAKVHDRCC